MKKLLMVCVLCLSYSITLSACFSPGSSDIWYAATDNDVRNIKRLLKSGVDVDAQDYDGETALSSAASFGHLKAVKYLLSQGANPNIPNKSGDTALLSVGLISDSVNDDIEIIHLLAKAGANMDFQDSTGSTALHSAVMYGQVGFVKALLDNGANTEIKDNDNETPILFLCVIDEENHAVAIFDLLQAKGANINAADNDGDTLATYEDCREKRRLFKYMKAKGLK